VAGTCGLLQRCPQVHAELLSTLVAQQFFYVVDEDFQSQFSPAESPVTAGERVVPSLFDGTEDHHPVIIVSAADIVRILKEGGYQSEEAIKKWLAVVFSKA